MGDWKKENKELRLARNRRYYENNKNKIKERGNQWKLNNRLSSILISKKATRKYNLKKKFGLTLEDYESLIIEHNGLCKICKKKNKNGKDLCLDHNHNNNRVRGLLCDNCNIGIGILQEDLRIFKSCIEYIENDLYKNVIDSLELCL